MPEGRNRRKRRAKAANMITIRKAASEYIATHKAGWKNEKHIWQWSQTLESFAFPVIGDLPVASVDTGHILEILKPLWLTKTETASRLRGRLEKILDWARVQGFRQGENPARWQGHLDHLLAKSPKVQKRQHHPALPYAELPAFMALLRQKEGVSALALQFQIYDANRSGEILGARWQEFDLDAALWTIPAERMKMQKEHRIPLSPAAMDILRAMKEVSQSEHVFPGRRGDKPLSDMAMLMTLRRIGRPDLTSHGFRSFPRLVRRTNVVPARSLVRRRLPMSTETGGGRLSPLRSSGTAARADGGMGSILLRRL